MLAIHLVCDAIALSYLGCYGSEWVETPHLNRLAQDGLLFDHCFVPLDVDPGGWRGHTLDAHPQHWGDSKVAGLLLHDSSASPQPIPGIETVSTGRKADPVEDPLELAADWIGSREQGETSFVWVELRMRGSSWSPSTERLQKHLDQRSPVDLDGSLEGMRGTDLDDDRLDDLRDTYAARIEELDARIGTFLQFLRDRDLYEPAMIVFTAEQGWPLGEHESIGHWMPWLHEERDHVPFILKAPGVRAGSRSPSFVSVADLAPTLAAFLGRGDFAFAFGINLFPLASGQPVATREYIVSGFQGFEHAIRTQSWKLILPVRRGDPPRVRMLFEKPDDRWEFHDQALMKPDIADHLELQLRRYLDAIDDATLDELPPLRMDILTPTKAR